jgi:uncharacterized protein DUF1697
MPVYIALLRAVNVGGTGKLPMAELKAMCIDAGFAKVQTYIARQCCISFENVRKAGQSDAGETPEILLRKADRRLGPHSRRIGGSLKANPFKRAAANRTVAIFPDERPPADALRNRA